VNAWQDLLGLTCWAGLAGVRLFWQSDMNIRRILAWLYGGALGETDGMHEVWLQHASVAFNTQE
jgi:hypothetical protein